VGQVRVSLVERSSNAVAVDPNMTTDSVSSPGKLRVDRLCANLSFLFTEWPFLDRFGAAAEAGFTAVEFLFPYDHAPDVVARAATDNGLEIALFNAPPGDWAKGERGMAALPGREDEFRQSMLTAIDYAKVLQVARLHVMAGIADPANPVAMDIYRRNLSVAAELAAPLGAHIMIEPINGHDMPGYFLNHFDTAADIVESSEGIGLQFDIYHCHRLHGDVLPRLRKLLPLTRHIQIAGVPARHEPEAPALPLTEIFSCLDRNGYAGRVGCEYHPANGTLAGLGWIDTL